MSANLRDNFRGTIIKFFCLALFILFFCVGLAKQVIYGKGVPARHGLSSAADGRDVSGTVRVSK